jgi:hypothetical protein
MLYSEIIAVCSQIHTKHINTLCGHNVECRTYRAVNTPRLGYKNQSVNAVQWNNRCLFWIHRTHKYTVCGGAEGTWWRGWLRYCATRRKVTGSIPDRVIGVDSAANKNEYQLYLMEGKGGLCVELKTLSPSCSDCLEILASSISRSSKDPWRL